tara:strand:+ start:2115 stop:2969 length:855 start_codon:yes stop_codon:yes gene_type:complete
MKQSSNSEPVFWRDERIPHLELRYINDGDRVCYAPHSHVEWSMGVITSGASSFCYGEKQYAITQGTQVFINPDKIHACNPVPGEHAPWSYIMFYVDAAWLAALRYQLGLLEKPVWQDMDVDRDDSPTLTAGALALVTRLVDERVPVAGKEAAIRDYFATVMQTLSALSPSSGAPKQTPPSTLAALARYLDEHCSEELSLELMSERAGYSTSHLVRSFRRYFGLTPHAYQLNRRIQLGRKALQQGATIADVAYRVGFADQPHFQRAFKKRVAATPGQYLRSAPTE